MATRRSLAGGAALALLGTTARAKQEHPASDAELITLCTQFDAIERRYYQVFAAESRRGDPDAAEAAMDTMRKEHETLLDQITSSAPTTIGGAVALAATLQGWSHGDFADGGCTDDRLARTLIEGLAKLSPDAHLLRFKHDDPGKV